MKGRDIEKIEWESTLTLGGDASADGEEGAQASKVGRRERRARVVSERERHRGLPSSKSRDWRMTLGSQHGHIGWRQGGSIGINSRAGRRWGLARRERRTRVVSERKASSLWGAEEVWRTKKKTTFIWTGKCRCNRRLAVWPSQPVRPSLNCFSWFAWPNGSIHSLAHCSAPFLVQPAWT